MDFLLSNGVRIPSPGFGTWSIPKWHAGEIIRDALNAGYRHIDTASYYGNETSIGMAIRDASVPRSELFITSKVWTDCRGYENTIRSFENSILKLVLDYLDLFLIYWPATPEKQEDWKILNAETWRGLESLYKNCKVRAIGVSNFQPVHLDALMDTAEIAPMVNQIEFHPGFCQRECVDYCKARGIVLEAWSPLGRGEALSHPTILKLAGKYNMTAAQVCIRWAIQCGLLPLVKSSGLERMNENMKDTDPLSPDDVEVINAIPFFGRLGYSPETVKF